MLQKVKTDNVEIVSEPYTTEIEEFTEIIKYTLVYEVKTEKVQHVYFHNKTSKVSYALEKAPVPKEITPVHFTQDVTKEGVKTTVSNNLEVITKQVPEVTEAVKFVSETYKSITTSSITAIETKEKADSIEFTLIVENKKKEPTQIILIQDKTTKKVTELGTFTVDESPKPQTKEQEKEKEHQKPVTGHQLTKEELKTDETVKKVVDFV